MIEVEVAYAMPDKQILLRLEVPDGTTAMEAIKLSGIKRSFPEMVIEAGVIGIFSQKVPLDQLLKAGDRVEIYRPLIADPKESRRRRAARAATQ